MRRFEERYRLNEGDDVLNRENAIHQDVDLRLDAVEQDAEAFRAGNRADIEAILKSLEQTFGTLAAEMRGLLDQTVGGLSADIIVETAARYFLTDARRAAILSDLRGGVDASGDTLAKLLALIVGVVGGAPAGRQSLKAINDAVVANTATLSAITNGADPTLDSFAEALTRFVIDEGQISSLMTMVGNRLRLDAPGGYSDTFRGQGRANLLGAPASVSTSGTFSVADVGRKVRTSGTITRTLPAISSVFAGWATGEVENAGTGIVTVAAGAGDAFEGLPAGSIALLPKQRAYFYLDADGWHVGWVDRCPLVSVATVTTAVGSVAMALPAGYGGYQLLIGNLVVDTAGANFNARFSSDGGASFKAGSTDYFYQFYAGSTSIGSASNINYAANSASALELLNNLSRNSGVAAEGYIRATGNTNSRPYVELRSGYIRVDGNYLRVSTGRCDALSSADANAVQFVLSSGNMVSGSFSLRGIPST